MTAGSAAFAAAVNAAFAIGQDTSKSRAACTMVRPSSTTADPIAARDLAVSRWRGGIDGKAHARIRRRGERAVATLKSWKILTKLRCSPSRTTAMVQAILVLHRVENPTYQG